MKFKTKTKTKTKMSKFETCDLPGSVYINLLETFENDPELKSLQEETDTIYNNLTHARFIHYRAFSNDEVDEEIIARENYQQAIDANNDYLRSDGANLLGIMNFTIGALQQKIEMIEKN